MLSIVHWCIIEGLVVFLCSHRSLISTFAHFILQVPHLTTFFFIQSLYLSPSSFILLTWPSHVSQSSFIFLLKLRSLNNFFYFASFFFSILFNIRYTCLVSASINLTANLNIITDLVVYTLDRGGQVDVTYRYFNSLWYCEDKLYRYNFHHYLLNAFSS